MCFAVAVLICGGRWVAAAQPASSRQDGAGEVVRVFEAKCAECHQPRKRSGKLNLASLAGLARGGDSGEAVVPGDVELSLLWQRVDMDEMPPEEPLAADDKDVIRRWIEAGAPGLEDASAEPEHWAFVPPVRPEVPSVQSVEGLRTPLDYFVQQRLEAQGLSIGDEADRTTLIRRLSFALTGLPPSVDEIATFLADPEEDAWERLVEHYLNSPHYGERWGQQWLDAAGYADSNGYFSADTDRPLAYKYRDYVIRAINEDRPFDQFLTEQLAGDHLAGYEPGSDVTPNMVELLTATHFLRNAQDGTDSSDGNDDERLLDRYTVLEGTVQIVGSALLGLTLQCARCHDHKFEPVSQEEYYSLQAIFFPAYCPEQWQTPNERVVSVGTRAERMAHAEGNAQIDRQIEALRESVQGAATPLREQLLDDRLKTLDLATREAVQLARVTAENERTDEQSALLKQHAELLDISDDTVAERYAEYAGLRDRVNESIAQAERARPEPLEELAILANVVKESPAHHVLLRGNYRDLGGEVAPGIVGALCTPSNVFGRPEAGREEKLANRLELSRWITSPEHPTLARITVNRVWQCYFGVGIVSTVDNFGYTGATPTHPKLLDYLACELRDNGWSVKHLHRMIVHSAVFRQQSDMNRAAFAIDPANQWLWRFPLRRLDAEALRDAMLFVSGELDKTRGGPYVPTSRQSDGEVVVDEGHPGARRRSIYLQRRRTQLLSMLEVFDAPLIVTNCTRRGESTMPLQSLSLLNSSFVTARAQALADRVAGESEVDTAGRIGRAFLWAWGRGPTAGERAAAIEFIEQQPSNYGDVDNSDMRAWADLCQMLLAANAFVYVE